MYGVPSDQSDYPEFRYTLAGWKELEGTMLDLSSSPENQDKITHYLATHSPPNTARAPTLMPGDTQIAFKEWQVPTLGQRSRDPIRGCRRVPSGGLGNGGI